MPLPTLNPDLTQRDDAPYWAAALVLAIRAHDTARAEQARRELQRLGINLTFASSRISSQSKATCQ